MDSSILLNSIAILLLFGLYGLIHSLLASTKVKSVLKNIFITDQYYRLFFNVVSVILLIPILGLIVFLPDETIYQSEGISKSILLALQAASVFVIIIAVWQTGMMEFIGLAKENPNANDGKLQTNGLYRWMRHPIYTFTMLYFWASPTMTANRLMLTISVSLYCYIGSIYEERKLVSLFGEQYIDFQKNVKRFIPFVF